MFWRSKSAKPQAVKPEDGERRVYQVFPCDGKWKVKLESPDGRGITFPDKFDTSADAEAFARQDRQMIGESTYDIVVKTT